MECLYRKKEPVLGFGVDLFTFEESLQYVHTCLKENKGMQIVTINPEMITLAAKNDEFASVLNNADLIIPDGVGIKMALKIKGISQENIPGIEFSERLIGLCELEGFSTGFIGAREEVIKKTIENIRARYGNINITYIRNGYFDEEQENIIIEELKAVSPRVLFVAFGAPKQELFIAKLKSQMPQTIFIGVGGSFDVWSGMVKRAPVVYQKLGLEWLYRTLKDPARFKRIFPALPMFLIRVIIEAVHKNLVK